MSRRFGIVLAGGRGERLGLGIPKARVELAGRTLLERAVATLAGVCGEVVVVVPAGFDAGPAGPGARFAFDVTGHAGPLAGLVAGLDACSGADGAVLGVDFPCVSPAFMGALLDRLEADGALDAVVPRPGGVPQPIVCAIAARAAPRLRAALMSGISSARDALATLAVDWLDDSQLDRLPGGRDSLLNVNTPADLEVARRRVAPRGSACGAAPMSHEPLTSGGVPLTRVLPALRRVEPPARACWVYDLDALDGRARRMHAAFAPVRAHVAYALKANPLPALLATLRTAGLAAEAGSLGELEQAVSAGWAPESLVLNGNGRTPEEADWVATRGAHSINADSIEELALLEQHAAARGRTLRVALRVNPDIDTPVHRYISTGHDGAKFGVAPAEALEAWAARARWPHLKLDGVHLHVGSQLQTSAPHEQAVSFALELARESAARGAPLGLLNVGGGFGVDYTGGGEEFPLERHAETIAARASAEPVPFEWAIEPGRWLTAVTGVLLAEVLWVKRRGKRRFVVLAAGLNDLLRPALYGARHRIVPLVPRADALEPATVVGPVCESSDCFDEAAPLPPLEPGDVVAILDAGAYGSAMSSNYNGRGRLAELVTRNGTLTRVRAGETPGVMAAREIEQPLGWV